MKVSTDAVLLGAWVNPIKNSHILDVGTGTGVIALMLAQKSPDFFVTAIDIDKESTEQAKENVDASPFKDQVKVEHISFQELSQKQGLKYNLIVTNPPYFIDSLKSNDDTRKIARHNDSLSFMDLINGVKKLLDEKGKFCLILPNNEAKLFREMAQSKGLYLSKLMRVKTHPDKDIEKRHLMQFEFRESEFSESTLLIEEETPRNYTREYRELTREYYISF